MRVELYSERRLGMSYMTLNMLPIGSVSRRSSDTGVWEI